MTRQKLENSTGVQFKSDGEEVLMENASRRALLHLDRGSLLPEPKSAEHTVDSPSAGSHREGFPEIERRFLTTCTLCNTQTVLQILEYTLELRQEHKSLPKFFKFSKKILNH